MIIVTSWDGAKLSDIDIKVLAIVDMLPILRIRQSQEHVVKNIDLDLPYDCDKRDAFLHQGRLSHLW